MKDSKIGLSVLMFILFLWMLIITITDYKNSSPVEEMYHRQLVITIDSILDSRFDVKDCVEDDDITLPHDSLGHLILPITD